MMDGLTVGIIATLTVLLGACAVALLGTYTSIRNARSDAQRRIVARANLVTWSLLAVLVPVILLAALGVLPSWTYGVSVIGALIVGLVAMRLMNRRPMSFHRMH